MGRSEGFGATLNPRPVLMYWIGGIALIFLLLVVLMRWKAADIYDAVIIRMTGRWYSEVLARIPRGQRVLDIGIGTGSALCCNAALVKSKKLHFVGVDYEQRSALLPLFFFLFAIAPSHAPCAATLTRRRR